MKNGSSNNSKARFEPMRGEVLYISLEPRKVSKSGLNKIIRPRNGGSPFVLCSLGVKGFGQMHVAFTGKTIPLKPATTVYWPPQTWLVRGWIYNGKLIEETLGLSVLRQLDQRPRLWVSSAYGERATVGAPRVVAGTVIFPQRNWGR